MVAAGLLAGAVPGYSQGLAAYDYEHLSFHGIGLDASHIWSRQIESATVYSMRLDLGYLGPGVRIAPSIGYWQSTVSERELQRMADKVNRLGPLRDQGVVIQGSQLGVVEWDCLFFSVDGQLVWIVPGGLLTYLGLGLGIHVLNSTGEAIEGTFVEEHLDAFSAGVAGTAGIEVARWRRVRLYGEVRQTLLEELQHTAIRFGAGLAFGGAAAPRN